MIALTNAPIITSFGRGGGPMLPKYLKHYLIFSFGFRIYGFTRGYRGLESTIEHLAKSNYLYELGKYKENQIKKNPNKLTIENFEKEFNKYYKNKINGVVNKISIMDKIKNGIMETFPFYLPVFNIVPIYCLVKRIELYIFRYPIHNHYKDKKYYTTSSSANVCYEII